MRLRPRGQQPGDFCNIGLERRLLQVLIVGQAQRQAVVRFNIQLPHEIFFPRCQDFVIHGLHISVSQEAQHPEVLGVSNEIGELFDDLVVTEVAPHDDLRHLEVILDGEDHLSRLLLRQFQLLKNGFHAFRARMHVIAFIVPMRLADVVKQ